jgi:Ala-tRNA(Pro) deacylase
MVLQRLREFLDHNRVKYATIHHSPAYTAQELAQATHVHGRELAKTVVVRTDDGRHAMVVVTAPSRVVPALLRVPLGCDQVELASETELDVLFPGCEVGAMPPFGNLFDLPVFVDTRLAEDSSIVFAAGTHHDCVRMSFADFRRLVEPTIGLYAALLR